MFQIEVPISCNRQKQSFASLPLKENLTEFSHSYVHKYSKLDGDDDDSNDVDDDALEEQTKARSGSSKQIGSSRKHMERWQDQDQGTHRVMW